MLKYTDNFIDNIIILHLISHPIWLKPKIMVSFMNLVYGNTVLSQKFINILFSLQKIPEKEPSNSSLWFSSAPLAVEEKKEKRCHQCRISFFKQRFVYFQATGFIWYSSQRAVSFLHKGFWQDGSHFVLHF